MCSVSFVFLVLVMLLFEIVWEKLLCISLGREVWLSSKLFISSLSAVDTCSGDGVARPSWLGSVWTTVLSVWQLLMSEQFREFREQSLKWENKIHSNNQEEIWIISPLLCFEYIICETKSKCKLKPLNLHFKSTSKKVTTLFKGKKDS